tara:strand:+ start:106 stop:834 length:729 start_codon:yes stop_codon:yes gene_type:complete
MNKDSDFFSKIKLLLKDTEQLKKLFPTINAAGYPFIALFFFIALLLSLISDFLGWIGFILSLWCVYFFRDPERVTPGIENIIVSPADGKIVKVDLANSPENLKDKQTIQMMKISIFMNVFNVHVNRIPVTGKVVWLKYIPGTFLNASLDKSSENNERMIAKIELDKNSFIYVVQIAGLVARRIKCDLTENQSVNVGERYGIIRFGSRLDVYLPKDFNVKVNEGQMAISGETILADFKLSKSK